MLRHAKKNMAKEYTEFQFVSVPSTLRLGLLISFIVLAGIKTVLKPPFVMAAVTLKIPSPQEEGWCPA